MTVLERIVIYDKRHFTVRYLGGKAKEVLSGTILFFTSKKGRVLLILIRYPQVGHCNTKPIWGFFYGKW